MLTGPPPKFHETRDILPKLIRQSLQLSRFELCHRVAAKAAIIADPERPSALVEPGKMTNDAPVVGHAHDD